MAKLLDVDALKRKARDIKRAEGISHTAALNRLAKEHGYTNWSLLMREQNKLHRDDAEEYGDDAQPRGENAHLSAYDQPSHLRAIFR